MVHEELISLKRLTLQGRKVAFTQAFLAWQRNGQQFTWSGSVRGAQVSGLVESGQEVALSAFSLDGRTVEGRVVVLLPEGLEGVLAFAGVGPLVVAGRAL